MKDKINKAFKNSIEVKKLLLEESSEDIESAATMLIECIKNGGKVICLGNGGSSADSQHFAAELVGRFKKERSAIGAISLATDNSVLTSLSNDYSFDYVFSRQIEALAKSADVLLSITTSGRSRNVINAIKTAKLMGLKTITLTGCGGAEAAKLSDLKIIVPSKDTPRIQEAHITIIHILCQIIEDAFCDG